MTLATQIIDLATRIGNEIRSVRADVDVLKEDTGWTGLTLLNGWAGTLEVRRISGFTYFRGQINRTPPVAGAFATLPAGFAPTGANRIFLTPSNGLNIAKVSVGTTGGVAVSTPPASGTAVVWDAVSYLI